MPPGMSLLDVEQRAWSKEMLSALEIPAGVAARLHRVR